MSFTNTQISLKCFIKLNGYFAATETVWLKELESPAKVWDIRKDEYPVVSSIRANKDLIRGAGYNQTGQFMLPASDWLDD